MLAILTSHPIQYQAPLWRALAEDGRMAFQVWFLTDHAVKDSFDREFDRSFSWDQNLLAGYDYRFLPVKAGWRLNKFFGVQVIERWRDLYIKSNITHLWVEGWRFYEFWAAIYVASKLGIKVLMRGETNDLSSTRSIKKILRSLLLKRLFRRVDYFLVIGSANRRFYAGHGVGSEKYLDAPYSVDNEYFRTLAEEKRSERVKIRQTWKIPDDSFTFLFCGKFIPKKRPLDLVDGLRRLIENHPNRKIHALYVGSGELGTELRNRCNVVFDEDIKIGTTGSVVKATFTGFLNQSKIVDAYVASDCLVLPSDTGETWGLVVNEAMGTGLPCVVSDSCGCAEDLVKPICEKWIFTTGDIKALGSSLEEVIEGTIERRIIEKHLNEFSYRKTVSSVVQATLKK